MKKLMLVSVMMVSLWSYSNSAVNISGGVGAVVPDNESVESTVVGRAEVSYSLSQYLSLGVSVGQTGRFTQNQVPQEVVFAQANPQGFYTPQFRPHGGDVIIIENYDNSTTINVQDAPHIPTKRPTDLTEREFWSTEFFLQPELPLYGILSIYARAFIGANGIRTASGSTDVALSKGLGGGIVRRFGFASLAAEALRRHADTGKNTYGNWEFMAKGIVKF